MAGMQFACPHCQILIVAPSEFPMATANDRGPAIGGPRKKKGGGKRFLIEAGVAVAAILIVLSAGLFLVWSKKPRIIEAERSQGTPPVVVAAIPEEPPAAVVAAPEPALKEPLRFESEEKPSRSDGISDEVLQAELLVIENRLFGFGLCPTAAKLSARETQKQAQIAFDAAVTRWQRLDGLGISTRKPDREAILEAYTEGMGNVQGKESSTITGALVTLQDRSDLTEDERKTILDGINAVRIVTGDTPWKRENARRAALSELDAIGKRVIGVSFRRQSQDAFLDTATSRNAFEIANGEVQARLRNLIGEALKKRGFDKTYGEGTSEDIEVLYSTLGDLDYSRITSALVAADSAEAKRIVKDAEGLEDLKKTRLAAILQRHENDAAFAKALEASDPVVANNEAIQPLIRDQDASRTVKEALKELLGSP